MRWTLCLISLLACIAAPGCGPGPEAVLKVFHAGSLSVPFELLERAFEAGHPGVDVRREAYGSAMAIRQVTELQRPADVVASADYRLIERMMIESKPPWADWNLLFARNAMCVAYGPQSPQVTPENWAEVLRRPEVRVGISNPNYDPCGYRSLMMLWLAQQRVGATGLFDDLILKNSNIQVEQADGGSVINVPGRLEFGGGLIVRPKETDLAALLESGAIDYALIYRSIAVHQGLSYVQMPPDINLSRPELADLYGAVAVRLSADRPESGVSIECGPIVYGITIPASAAQPDLAEEFVRLLISEQGRKMLTNCGMAPLSPVAYSGQRMPDAAPF